MQIVDLEPAASQQIEEVAALLVEAFREHHPDAWPDLESARATVQESFGPDRLSRVALDDRGQVLGWIGALPDYDGHVWELHPLVVRPARQGQGIGRRLVADLEAWVRARGGGTIRLGTDDENNQTSLGGVDLYPQPLAHLAQIRNLRRHPYEFYQKLGYALVGVVPDANGWGKPDICMAKRITTLPQEAAGL
ncbi:MAG TPA: GNAT family N-acetyltransferase [Chloroflexia bacterium]|nr:GNAT family N-acetyltransferase [Chloroflexia bacterium]